MIALFFDAKRVAMKGIIAGILIVIVGAIALAVTGFMQIVRAWSDIFR